MLSTALHYISDNLLTISSITEISDAVFITESYLYRLFKTELRTSPKKYIMQKRLLYAEKLIRKGHRPTEIFAECGLPTLAARAGHGGSDAAEMTCAGVPCIDSLGVEGGFIHSADEYARVSSLAECAKRLAAIAVGI